MVQINEATVNNTEFIATSERYNNIKTTDVIDLFKGRGFEISDYSEARFRNNNKENKVRHMVRMSVDSDSGLRRDIVIFNSHDSSTSLRLNFGAYRGVCMNTLVFGDSLLAEMRIKHTSLDPFERINLYAEQVMATLDEEKRLREKMMKQQLSFYDIHNLATKAIAIREKAGTAYEEPLDPTELILVRRQADQGKDVWTVFNRIQEALVNGHYQKQYNVLNEDTGKYEQVIRKAKELKSPNELIRVNKELHEMCTQLVY